MTESLPFDNHERDHTTPERHQAMQHLARTFALAFLCACSGKVIDIGSNQGTGGQNGVAAGSGGAASSTGGSSLGGGDVAAGGAGDYGLGGAIGAGGSFGGYAGGALGGGGGGSVIGGVGNAGSTGAAGTAMTAWPVDSDCKSGAQLPIVGAWEGYVENYMFPSGSDAVHLTITAANGAHVCGKVSFGTGTPPAPATDPNVGYPPSIEESAARSAGAGGSANFDAASEAYPLTILNGQATSTRVQFQVDTKELWKGWCELQTPYLQSGADYGCIPASGWASAGGNGCFLNNGAPLDCAKAQLCSSAICTCTARGCTVSPQGDVSFDLHVQSANEFSGSATLSGLHNVYLKSVP